MFHRVIAVAFLVAMLPLDLFAQAAQVPVPMNMPQVVTTPVVPGSVRTSLQFSVDHVDSLLIQLIAPVDGSSVEIREPGATPAARSTDAGTKFIAGSTVVKPSPLPGGVFTFEDVPAQGRDGIWTIDVTHPPAPMATALMATIHARSDVQIGFALQSGGEYLTGDRVPIGLLVLDGTRPITGLAPRFTIAREGGGPLADARALDDGQSFDGRADDGIYSIDHVFPAAGTYVISAAVDVPAPGRPVLRTATRTVEVRDRTLLVNGARLQPTTGRGCIAGMDALLDLDVRAAGAFAVYGFLQDAGGARTEARARFELPAGRTQQRLRFNAADLRKAFPASGSLSLDKLMVIQDDGSDALVEMRRSLASGTLNRAQLCRTPIEIIPELTTELRLQDGAIAAIDLAFPVDVVAAGTYRVSLKVLGAAGQDVDLSVISTTLVAGRNVVRFSIPAAKLQGIDGPYTLASVLVLGAGASAQRSRIGSTPALERWQILPRLRGDLDDDSDVDAADRSVLLGFRSIDALRPGDQRDLNRDGKIDVRDARAILPLMCAAGACPVNF